MCGITGYVEFGTRSDSNVLKGMTNALSHRGPDDSGCETFQIGDANIGLGQTRLSILDLSPGGHQPMHFDSLSVVFNGEIYNFMEIRSELEREGYSFITTSDTEVILKAYHRWGIGMLNRFIGMYAIALVDRAKMEIYLIRDRAGVKPMYIYEDQGNFLFASELKAFHQYPGFKKNVDKSSISLFLQYNYIPAPYTIFKNVTKLLPGHFLKISIASHSTSLIKYWDVNDYYRAPLSNDTLDEVIRKTESLLLESYKLRMVSDVPVGVFLSGGYDSTSVTALLQSGMTDRLKTFTIGFAEEEFNEAREAKKISEYLGTDHHEWYVEPKDAEAIMDRLPEVYDEPFADNSVIPTILVSLFARRHVKVALSADGGDEIFAGYAKFNQAIGLVRKFPRPVLSLMSNLMGVIDPKHIPFARKAYNFSTRYDKICSIWKDQSSSAALKIISQYFTEREIHALLKEPGLKYKTFFDADDAVNAIQDELNRLLAIDYKTFLVDNNLVKVDRASMSVGLEGREPMLDHRLIEYLATIPSGMKVKNGVNKWLLKEIVHKYVPREIMERPKRPFIAPLGKWFRGELSELMRYYLSVDSVRKSGVFNPEEVGKLLDDYLSGGKLSSQKLWNILVFQIWYSRWIEKL